VEIRRRRSRRHAQPEAVEEEPIWGARSPGVRSRRQIVPVERDLNMRLRERLEARRGFGGPTVWTFDRR
jgi:hypothetical protein